MNQQLALGALSPTNDFLEITWGDGHVSKFHHLWLRDNCSCTKCGDHESGSRFQSFIAIPEDIKPSVVESHGDSIKVIWAQDGHESEYPIAWLRRHCYSDKARAVAVRQRVLWDSTLTTPPTASFERALSDPLERYKLFSQVNCYGFVVVRDVGIGPEQTMELANLLGYIRDTHFGRMTDLTLRDSGMHLSDYSVQILPHTDETYRTLPTGINIFHCIIPSGDGGGISTLVDSHLCANKLREADPTAFQLLSTTPIRHARRAQNEIIESQLPPFTLDHKGDVSEVRLNERTMSAICVAPDQVRSVYSALRKAFVLAYSKQNRYEYRLAAGEALVFDNLRVLHGRTIFRGTRLLRQTNVMRDEFYARLAHLEEELHASRSPRVT